MGFLLKCVYRLVGDGGSRNFVCCFGWFVCLFVKLKSIGYLVS